MKPILLIGAGGHARVCLEALRASGQTVAGIIDRDQPKGSEVLGVAILGGDEVLETYGPEKANLVLGIGTLGKDQTRSALFSKFKKFGFSFAPLVHPSAIVPGNFKASEGVQIMAGAIVQIGTSIGENTIVNTGAKIDHDCSIGRNCHIAPGVTLSGTVEIGDDVHVGTGAIVIQSIKIGSQAFVAAGAVVVKDLASKARIYPARSVIKGELQHD